MKKIMFAADGSKSAQGAAELARKFLEAWPQATVEVVYVIQVHSIWSDGPSVLVDELTKDVKENSLAPLWGQLDRVHFRHVVDVASPAVVLSRLAKEEGFDLIIAGSHGRNRVNRLLLGSVSHELVHRSEVPVLIARYQPPNPTIRVAWSSEKFSNRMTSWK